MSTKVYYNWEELNINWESVDMLWEDVYYIIGEVTGNNILGGARNPYEDEQIKYQLEKLNQTKTDKLIQILILLGNVEYKEKKKKGENIKITVNDVRTIIKEYLKVEVI